jgi:hypothetical protein
VTVVETPPQRQPSQDELEALIEEARRRTRRRRLIIAASVLGVLLAGAAVFGGVVLTRGGSGSQVAAPPGYHVVQAKGPVSHATITEYPPTRSRVVDVASGNERSAPLVLEVWWDRRTGFDRVVGRVDGRVQFDAVGQTCQGPDVSRRFCLPPPPFVLENMHYRWPIDPKAVRVVDRGSYRGHDVIWLEALTSGKPSRGGDRVALDSVTHRPLARRSFARGRLFYEERYSLLRDLPAKSVSFVVPDGGAVRNSFPPLTSAPSSSRKATLAVAQHAVGPAALWLGKSYRGQPLRSVEVGADVSKAPNGSVLRRAKFVRFDYGSIRLQEFGRVKPLGFVSGPRPGRILVGGNIMLSRDGLLVIADVQPLPIDTAAALGLAKALRPIPEG